VSKLGYMLIFHYSIWESLDEVEANLLQFICHLQLLLDILDDLEWKNGRKNEVRLGHIRHPTDVWTYVDSSICNGI